jgi:hypothetical protein
MYAAIYLAGAFTLVLGAVHIVMPVLFDFKHAIPSVGPALKPFRLLFFRYDTQRADVHAIAWVMNHHVSYVLLTIGLLDLTWVYWIQMPSGPLLATWIAVWWFLRAANQLYLGRRRADWLLIVWFAFLGLLHTAVAVHV